MICITLVLDFVCWKSYSLTKKNCLNKFVQFLDIIMNFIGNCFSSNTLNNLLTQKDKKIKNVQENEKYYSASVFADTISEKGRLTN